MIEFFIPQWIASEAAGNKGLLEDIRHYVDGARRGSALPDDQIARDVDEQWPGVIPGGAHITTCSDGAIWVTSLEFERGNA
jgi:hypothetical protein